MLWQGAQPLNADEIRVGQYKSLNVYHGSEKPRRIARRKRNKPSELRLGRGEWSRTTTIQGYAVGNWNEPSTQQSLEGRIARYHSGRTTPHRISMILLRTGTNQ